MPKELRSFPISYFDLEQNLGLFGNLVGAIPGDNHPITRNCRVFWTALVKRYRQRLRNQLDSPRSSIKPVHILRNVQLVCYDWFEAKRALGDPEAPNFLTILKTIGLGSYVPPLLPLPLYQLVNPRPTPTLHPTPFFHPQGGGQPSLTVTSVTTDDGASVAGSMVSGLTGATGLSSGTRKTSSLVVNESPDHTLLTLIPFNRRIKDLIGNTAPPNMDAGIPICLLYHVKGGCYSNCRRKANHHQVLNAAEKERLGNYVADRLEKLSKP